MKRNNVNRVLLNDFLGADYADYADYTDYSVDTNTLNVTFLRQKNPCNPCNPRLKNRSIEPYFTLFRFISPPPVVLFLSIHKRFIK